MSDGTCSEDDCRKPVLARGWCGTHYARWRRARQPKRTRTGAIDRAEVSKTCSACQATKPLGEFYRRRDRAGETRWLSAECKACANARTVRDAGLRDAREPATSGPTCAADGCDELVGDRPRAGSRRQYCSRKCKHRMQSVLHPMPKELQVKYDRMRGLRRYGLTEETFAALLATQGGRCAICRTTEAGGKGRWHVDHCHTTGRVRGLLCHHCNVGLGNFKDDPDLLMTAIAYLKAVV